MSSGAVRWNGNFPVHWEVRSTSVSEAIDNVTSKGIQIVRIGQPSFQGCRRDLDVADVHPLPVQEGLRKRRWPQPHVNLDVAGQLPVEDVRKRRWPQLYLKN